VRNCWLIVFQEDEHKYRLHAYSYYGDPLPEFITLHCHDEVVPLPDREFLYTHYVISKILNVSGLVKKFSQRDSPTECWDRQLKEDGSTDFVEVLGEQLLMAII
jgi:hypothetical protein